jgi:hypothetical protein
MIFITEDGATSIFFLVDVCRLKNVEVFDTFICYHFVVTVNFLVTKWITTVIHSY